MIWSRRLAELGMVLLTASIALVITHWLPFVVMTENWLDDYRVATLSPLQEQSPDIVIVTITDDTLQLFPYRTPVDRRFLASVLKDLDEAGAKAIGIDILFDQATEPEKDEELQKAIRNLHAALVVGVIGEGQGLDDDQIEFLSNFVPLEMRGDTTTIKDPFDATVRQMYAGHADANGNFIEGFPLRLAEKIHSGEQFKAQTIAWRGNPGNDTPPFRKFPAHALRRLPAELFKGKIILIGADQTLTDRFRTPFATVDRGIGLIPGVEIHAHALDHLLEGRHPQQISFMSKLLFALGVSTTGVLLAQLGLRMSISLSLGAGVLVLIWVAGFALFKYAGIMIPLVMPTIALATSAWGAETQSNWREKRQKRFLKDAFSRYMSPALVNELVADPAKLALGGERRAMSFLFTDVAGFTTLSESIDPATLGSLLNSYFNGLCQIIIDEGGTVIDFIGDAVFAIFGAPIAHRDHAARGIACAQKIQAFSAEFRQSGAARVWNWGNTRIGVHSGFALVGNFGSDLKFKYAPVGDAVNTGSRIEGLNKFFGTTVCLSESTVEAAGFKFCRPLGRCVLKGRSEPIAVYEPMPEAWFATPFGKEYLEAYNLMAAGNDSQAKAMFWTLSLEDPTDACVGFHLGRVTQNVVTDVIVMLDK